MAARSAEKLATAPEREIVATRTFAAPRELVWAAWTDPKHVARWWGPRGFTNTVSHMDVRPGGAWRFVMHGPDGTDYRNEMSYVEVVPPERIVMDHVSGPSFRLTATLSERGGETTVTMRMTFPSAAEHDRAVAEFHADEGLVQNLEKLGEYVGAPGAALPAPREMVVTRVLDAPRALVFDAWATPGHLARWWGPRGFTLAGCDVDFRPGGAYRMVMRGPDGAEYPFHGVYREIVRPERIVFSAVIGPEPGNAVLTTVAFEDAGGRTRLTVRQTVPANAMAARGQEQGWTESLERLAAHVAATAVAAAPARDPAREIVLGRTYDAPRDLVFAAFTDPAHLPRWWGPRSFTVETSAIDVRPGGAWRFTMRGPDGVEYPNRIVWREIARPDRISYVHDGGEDGDAETFEVTVTFDEDAGGTRVTMRSLFPTAAQRARVVGFGAIELGKTTLEKLGEALDGATAPGNTAFFFLPGEPVVFARRVLDAPRPLVWEAITRPEHVARWYGPRAARITRCEIDLTVGGAWRVEQGFPDGRTHGFGGVHREIAAPERIVRTWRWDGAPAAESIETMTLLERDGRTVVTMRDVHPSVAARDGHVRAGMQQGATEALDRLAALVATMRATAAASP